MYEIYSTVSFQKKYQSSICSPLAYSEVYNPAVFYEVEQI